MKWAFGLAILFTLFVAATSTSAATTTVIARENFFVGNGGLGTRVVTINVGDTVTWDNRGNQFHDVTFDDARSGTMAPGQTWSRTFSTAGSFSYICTLHEVEDMTGRVEVIGTATPTPTVSHLSRLLIPFSPRAAR
jgi:plastocyanin